MYAFTLSAYKAGIRGIDLHLEVRRRLVPPSQPLPSHPPLSFPVVICGVWGRGQMAAEVGGWVGGWVGMGRLGTTEMQGGADDSTTANEACCLDTPVARHACR